MNHESIQPYVFEHLERYGQILNQRNHGISTAECEQSDLCKYQEQLKQFIHMSFSAVKPP